MAFQGDKFLGFRSYRADNLTRRLIEIAIAATKKSENPNLNISHASIHLQR
jgi:hypothetical protein